MLRTHSVRFVFFIFMLQLLVLPVNTAVYAAADPFNQFVAVSAGELDSLRGGYQARNGLEFSFGIRQVTYIDGALYAATVLALVELGVAPIPSVILPQVVPAPVQAAVQTQVDVVPIQASAPTVQSVPTAYNPAGLRSMQTQLANLIQNSQNQRTFDHRTVIDISVNSLKVFRELSLSPLLQQQLDANLFR